MQYHIEWPDELHAIESKILYEIENSEKELHPNHAPTFTAMILKRIAFLNETLSIIASNPNITTGELASLVDHKLQTEERALKNANDVFESENIRTNIRILGWIKYLILAKNGRISESPHW
jgi:hypothetical protein